jgi:hypothetical protein
METSTYLLLPGALSGDCFGDPAVKEHKVEVEVHCQGRLPASLSPLQAEEGG